MTLHILHIGNGNEKHKGKRYYDVGRKLQHGLTRLNHNALFFSDRDSLRASGLMGTRFAGRQRCNDKLIEIARHFKPDMLLLGHADIITNDTLERIKALLPRVKMAQFNVDPLFRSRNHQAIAERIPLMDASFITTGGKVLNRYDNAHHKAWYIPNPIDPALESARVYEQKQPAYDVFYAIRRTPEQSDRLRLPRHLKAQVEGLRPHFFGFDGAPELFGRAFYQAISESAMGLNISHKETSDPPIVKATDEELFLYSSDRLSQYIGSGLLTLTERGFAQELLFEEGKEMVFFASAEELVEHMRYFKANPAERQRIAQRGWQKAHSRMNATLIADYIVRRTMGESLAEVPYWEGVSEKARYDKEPNVLTKKAIQEMESGIAQKAENSEDFYKDIGIAAQ